MKEGTSRLLILLLSACLVGAVLVAPLWMRETYAACNSAANNRFSITDLEIKTTTSGKISSYACINSDVEFKVSFNSDLAAGDSATFACVWSGDVSSTVSHAVQTGVNTLALIKRFDSTGSKTVTFAYSGTTRSGETCSGSVSINVTVIQMEIATPVRRVSSRDGCVDFNLTTNSYAAGGVQWSLEPCPAGAKIDSNGTVWYPSVGTNYTLTVTARSRVLEDYGSAATLTVVHVAASPTRFLGYVHAYAPGLCYYSLAVPGPNWLWSGNTVAVDFNLTRGGSDFFYSRGDYILGPGDFEDIGSGWDAYPIYRSALGVFSPWLLSPWEDAAVDPDQEYEYDPGAPLFAMCRNQHDICINTIPGDELIIRTTDELLSSSIRYMAAGLTVVNPDGTVVPASPEQYFHDSMVSFPPMVVLKSGETKLRLENPGYDVGKYYLKWNVDKETGRNIRVNGEDDGEVTIDCTGGWPRDYTVVSLVTDSSGEEWIEGAWPFSAEPLVVRLANSYVGHWGPIDTEQSSDCSNLAWSRVALTAVKIEIAMDGNRDDSITFGDTNDNHYLFWVNDDDDVISGGEEDDAQSGTANCNDSAITCKRDLEDFTRLHVKVDNTTASLPGITYFLKFENVSSGPPSVNIFEAVGASSAYLSDTSVAAHQIQETKLITVGTNEVQLPNQYIKTGDQVSPFILEGKTAGKGDLTIIVKKDGNEVCKKAVTLDLRPITAFCEKYVVTVSTGDDVNTTDGGNANSTTYTPETDEYVLHVHGWNMADWEKNRWTETVFKRLWWQRYKGHVGGFQWPTYTGSLTYDASEIRAWRSGQALNNRIASLNATYSGQVRVLAHSMGNVVMGEALRLFSSSVVHTYIAAQAAIPAHCYDNTISSYWTGFGTPNMYARYSSGLSPDTPYLAANSSHAGAMALYFNAQDYALGWWEINNEMKPDFNYWYTEGDSNTDSYAPASGDRFYYDSLLPFDERTMVIPADRFEIFARVVESRSRALGRVSSASGFGTARNLQDWGYDREHYSHSREFRSNVADEWLFWNTLFGDAGLAP